MKRTFYCLAKLNLSTAVSTCVVSVTLLLSNPGLVNAQPVAGLTQYEKIEAQETRYRNAIRRNPADIHAYSHLANLLMQQKRYGEAVSVYQEAVESTPSAQGLSDLGLALNFSQRYEAAEEAYGSAIRQDPSLADAHRGLGDALLYQGRIGDAQVAYKEALGLDSQLPEAYFGMAITLFAQGSIYEAASFVQTAVNQKPSLNNTDHIQAEIFWRTVIAKTESAAAADYYSLAYALEDKNRLEDAENVYRETIWIDPSYKDAYYRLGHLLVGQNRLNDAIAVYQSGTEALPIAEMYHSLGWVFGLADQNNESEAAYRQAIQLVPGESNYHFGLGYALMGQDRFDESIAAFKETIKLDPANARAHLVVGFLLAAQGAEDEARGYVETAFTLDPSLIQEVEQYTSQR
ncbi:MAG: tetratricopeptide repeat protein [Cyanobacteria bacterium P01_D01_bin.56]